MPSAVFIPQSIRKKDKQLIGEIYKNGTGGVNDALLQRYAGGFDKAITSVFGADDEELQQRLRLNASRFGTYKAYEVSRKLEALRGLPGGEFEKEAEKLLNQYNGFQEAEYNTLKARSRSTRQFLQFKQEALIYPNIEWLHSRSANPREKHLQYVGIILPIDHPFWNDNQPGNEYNCKCDWRTTDKPATSTPNSTIKPAPGFEGNPAATGELVTDNHPYFKRNANAPKWVEEKAVLQAPDEVVFNKTETSAGSYLEHLLLHPGEAQGNREIVTILLENGYKNITLLPQLNRNEKTLRARYFGKEYAGKHPTSNPDAIIDSNIVEFKATGRRNLSVRIHESAIKSDIAVVKLKELLPDTYLDNFVARQWEMPDRKNLVEIIIYNGGELKVYKRKKRNS